MSREEKIAQVMLMSRGAVAMGLSDCQRRRWRLQAKLREATLEEGLFEEALARLDGSSAKEPSGSGSEPRT